MKISISKVQAHCDIPCKIYDPGTAQYATLSVIRLLDLINELPDSLSIAQQAQLIADNMVGTRQKILITGHAKRDPAQLSGRTENNRVVNFACDDTTLIGDFVEDGGAIAVAIVPVLVFLVIVPRKGFQAMRLPGIAP